MVTLYQPHEVYIRLVSRLVGCHEVANQLVGRRTTHTRENGSSSLCSISLNPIGNEIVFQMFHVAVPVFKPWKLANAAVDGHNIVHLVANFVIT